MNIVTTKLRILLFSIWYLLIIFLLVLIVCFHFDLTKHVWFFIFYAMICLFIRPFTDKVAPKKKRRDDDGNN